MLPEWRQGQERERERRHAAVRPTAEGTEPTHPLESYTGTYRSELYGDGEISLEDGGLVLRLLPNPDLVADLAHLQHDTYRIDWRTPLAWFGKGTAHFVLGATGSVDELELDVPNQDLWFTDLKLIRREPR